jgi:hypothetical protein
MYSFKGTSFAVKIECFIILCLQAIQTKNGHCVLLEDLKKEVRRPRRTRVEHIKHGVGESVCKKVDSITCLSIGQGERCMKSGDKASVSVTFRRFIE